MEEKLLLLLVCTEAQIYWIRPVFAEKTTLSSLRFFSLMPTSSLC